MTTTTNGNSHGAAASLSDDSHYVAFNLIMKHSVSMALKAVLKLGIPEIIASAEGKRPLSAGEILAQLPTKSSPGPNSISNLRRLLDPLVREGFFSTSFNGNKELVYGLTEVSKLFTKSNEMSMLGTADLKFRKDTWSSWDNLHEVILDESITPFEKAHGLPLYEYMAKKDPQLGAQFRSMSNTYNKRALTELLDLFKQSGLLSGVNTLLDVGGNQGYIVGQIVKYYPHIQGINFDLQYVIATAPSINGVQHVAGSFFESVPPADAMFLKLVIHNYGDEQAIQILENCFEALPKNGKIMLAENIKNEQHDQSVLDEYLVNYDLQMLLSLRGARERTNEEYQGLLKAAGFTSSTPIRNPRRSLGLIAGFKE